MFYNPAKSRFFFFTYLLFFLIPVYLYWGKSLTSFSLYRIGQLCGVLGITGLVLQMTLTSRLRWLERGVGYDRITRLHKANGKLLFTFLLFHPTLMFWDKLINPSLWWSTLMTYTIYHWLGVTALLLIFSTITITLYGHMVKLNYEHWKVIHKVGYIIIVLGFIHSFFLGSDIQVGGKIYYWWLFLGALATYAFCYRNIYRPLKWKNNLYTVSKIVPETKEVRTIVLEKVENRKSKIDPSSTVHPRSSNLQYAPGQFVFTRFFSPNLSKEEHHFTVSSSPQDPYLSFTIKAVGDFTTDLSRLKVGDKARLEGPYGSYSNQGMKGPFVFIAGGIGITPIRSMIRTMALTNQLKQSTLFYVNQTYDEAVFANELEEMDKKNSWFNLVHVLTKESKKDCYEGRLNADILKKEVKDSKGSTYFVCGPVPMMDSTVKILHELGVSKSKIFTERFALR